MATIEARLTKLEVWIKILLFVELGQFGKDMIPSVLAMIP